MSRPPVVFAGGTLHFGGWATALTISSVRLLTVASRGAFDISSGKTVVVRSTLAGSGRLIKRGMGELDLRNVQASMFTGALVMDAGRLKMDNGSDLGQVRALLFRGGTLSFASLKPILPLTITSLIGVGSSGGTFDIASTVTLLHRGRVYHEKIEFQGRLFGSGELRKTGSEGLDLSQADAGEFYGTLRIEEGKLHIDDENDLGDEQARLVLAGGGLDLGGAKLTVARPIIITENSELGGVYAQVNSTISVTREDVTLTITGRVSLGAARNYIEDIYIDNVIGAGVHLVGSVDALGSGPKQVVLNSRGYYYRDTLLDLTEGLMSNWTVSVGSNASLRKTGAGRLTVENSKIQLGGGFYIKEGTLVDRGGNEAGGFSVNAAATLEFEVAESNTFSPPYQIESRGGSLAKTGKGLLDLSGTNFHGIYINKFTFHEGTVSISEEKQLGIATYWRGSIRPTVVFAGGALRFGGSAATMTIGSGRLLTVASSGTLDTTDRVVVVDSTLSGSGLLNKAGSGKLDLRSVQADMFSGTLRIEGGELQIDGQDDLGKADGLVFAGGTLSIEGSSTPITLSNTIAVSAATGHKALFALNNTVAMEKDFIDGFDAKSTIKVGFQQGAAARLTIGFGQAEGVMLNNWIFSGGGNSIIDVGVDGDVTARVTINSLIANEADFRGKGMLNIGRQVVLHNQESRLSMSGWTVSIAARQRFIVSAGIVSEGTITLNHIGPKKLIGGGFMGKQGAGLWDMSATNGEDFHGKLNVFAGIVRIEKGNLGERSKINVDEGGSLEGGGEVGSVEIKKGGIWHQGTSSVTLHVRGNYTQNGGTYRVYLGPKFAAVTVAGTASLKSGILTVTAIDAVAMTNTYTMMYASSLTVGRPECEGNYH